MNFTVFAWFNLLYNLLVILFGAYVRATGSGAGCGSHWPTCHGEVIPRPKEIETLIEYTHRLTSGFSLILVIVLYLWAMKIYPGGHPVRKAAFSSLFFLLIEAFLGAGLVLFRYVAEDASIGRAYWMSAHLVNTLLLLAALSLTAYFASGYGKPVKTKFDGAAKWQAGLLVFLLLVGVSGALAALGDTLFPNTVGLRFDVHIYVSLRNLHPFIAIAGTIYLWITLYFTRKYSQNVLALKLANFLFFFSFLQLIVGVINILLGAPIFLQLVHLFLADILWIFAVILFLSYQKEHA